MRDFLIFAAGVVFGGFVVGICTYSTREWAARIAEGNTDDA